MPSNSAMAHRDNAADRKEGQFWEERFCEHAGLHERMFTAHQIGRKTSAQAIYGKPGNWHPLTLPDITIWSSPGEHHEIKNKRPTKYNRFGLEIYRFDSLVRFQYELLVGQVVYYTIHDWQRAGGKDAESRMGDWLTISIRELLVLTKPESESCDRAICKPFQTWYNGVPSEMPGWLWPATIWYPLSTLWEPPYATPSRTHTAAPSR